MLYNMVRTLDFDGTLPHSGRRLAFMSHYLYLSLSLSFSLSRALSLSVYLSHVRHLTPPQGVIFE